LLLSVSIQIEKNGISELTLLQQQVPMFMPAPVEWLDLLANMVGARVAGWATHRMMLMEGGAI
jgi:hypothetical protein